MEKFEGNSNISKQEIAQKRVDSPVTDSVKIKKENTLARKFFAQDLKSTTKGVTNDIVIPGIKNLLVNVLKKAVDYWFNGSYTPTNSNGYTNYNSIYSSPKSVSFGSGFNPSQGINGPVAPTNKSSIYSINDIVFNERGDAEEVLLRMNEIIGRYGMVSVLDFYDLIDQSKRSTTTDNKYGWKDLSAAYVQRTYDGYRIVFPRVLPLE